MYTRTMRHNPSPPNLLLPLFINNSNQRMKRASGLERAYPLQILAFKPKPNLGVCSFVSFPWCSGQIGRRLWC